MQLQYSATSRRPHTGFPRRYRCWVSALRRSCWAPMTALRWSSGPSHALNIISRPDGTPDLSGVPGAPCEAGRRGRPARRWPVEFSWTRRCLYGRKHRIGRPRKLGTYVPKGLSLRVCVRGGCSSAGHHRSTRERTAFFQVSATLVRRRSAIGGLEPENRLCYGSAPPSWPTRRHYSTSTSVYSR